MRQHRERLIYALAAIVVGSTSLFSQAIPDEVKDGGPDARITELERQLRDNPNQFDWAAHNELRHLCAGHDASKSFYHCDVIFRNRFMDSYTLECLGARAEQGATGEAAARLLKWVAKYPEYAYVGAACRLKAASLLEGEPDRRVELLREVAALDDRELQVYKFAAQGELDELALSAAPPLKGIIRVKVLRTLAVLYRDGKSDQEVAGVQRAIEQARLFYFRNTAARLCLDLQWLVVDSPPPDLNGVSIGGIEQDLRSRGVSPGDFDGVFAIGVGMKGNLGGFSIMCGAGAAHAMWPGDPPALEGYPDPSAAVNWSAAWLFVHEFQHALDGVLVGRSDLNMLHGHPYADHEEAHFQGGYQGGEHWDWIACTLRAFPVDGWTRVIAVRNTVIECVDEDEDGLPDDDVRLPADEKRLGTDSTRDDSDGDGLSDLEEFMADIYRGSDPRVADTDGDGVSDGADLHPTVAMADEMPYTAAGSGLRPILKGAYARNDGEGPVWVYGGWDETHLYFRFFGTKPGSVVAKVDGSAENGFWEGGDTYLLRFALDDVRFNGLGLDGPVRGAVARARPVQGTAALEVVLPAALGQGVSKEINYGGEREPEDRARGLTLAEGRLIGLNFIFEFTDGTRAVLTPHHSMLPIRLAK